MITSICNGDGQKLTKKLATNSLTIFCYINSLTLKNSLVKLLTKKLN